MNERILNLAQQAGWDISEIMKIQNAEKMQRFAELLVEEMYDFIMEESASDNGIPDLGKVKQHFGVEE